MPIKQFPPPTFLSDANWRKRGDHLMPTWTAVSESLSEDAWQGGIVVSYLVLKYHMGVYELWLFSDDCDDDPQSELSLPHERNLLWRGKEPTLKELNGIVSIFTDRNIYYLFWDDRGEMDYEMDRFVFAPDCEFEYMRLYGKE